MSEAITARPKFNGGAEDARPVLLLTTVDIGDGRNGTIKIREGDDPLECARLFCAEHGLPNSVIGHLAVHIQENLAQAVLVEMQEEEPQVEEQKLVSRQGQNLSPSKHQSARPASSPAKMPAYNEALVQYAKEEAFDSMPTYADLPEDNRLYTEHFRREIALDEQRRIRDLEVRLAMAKAHVTPVSKALAANRSAGGYANYGERLYFEGKMEAVKREQAAERARTAAKDAELSEATFTPEITPLAQTMKTTEKVSRASGGPSHWERLHRLGDAVAQRRKMRAELLQREKEDAELAECKFAPEIDSKSARIVARRVNALAEGKVAPYELLYSDADRRQKKLSEISQRPHEEATFAPSINPKSVEMTRKRTDNEEGANVASRLLARGKEYEERLSAARTMHPVDSQTGRPLFKPATCRPPQGKAGLTRNALGAPIGEYLYSVKQESDRKAVEMEHAAIEAAAKESSESKVNDRSHMLVNKLKKERFTAIYQYLSARENDSYSTGTAGVDLIETVDDESFMDTIDPEVRADVEFASRLLLKREGGSKTVNCELFCDLMEGVLERTRGLCRQYLLPTSHNRKVPEDLTFRPRLDPRSLAMAARRRPEGIAAHDLLYKTAEEVAVKKELSRRAREEEELVECSFRPALISAQLAEQGRALRMVEAMPGQKAIERPSSAPCSIKEMRKNVNWQRSAHIGRVLETSKRSIEAREPEPTASFGSSGGGPGIDALEKQINDALLRLSMAGDKIVDDMAKEAQQNQMQKTSFDFAAILGTPQASPGAQKAENYSAAAASSWGGFNPMEAAGGDDTPISSKALAPRADADEILRTDLIPALKRNSLTGLNLKELAAMASPALSSA